MRYACPRVTMIVYEKTTRKAHIMEKTDFIANVIITVMTDDPSKIIEAQDDAKMMIEAGADFGTSRADLMAEYALSVFKAQNIDAGHLPELKDLTEPDEERIIDLVSEHITNKGW